MASILSESTNSDKQEDLNHIINEAYGLLCEDKIEQSIQVYKKCIAEHPRYWRAYQNLGIAYIMAKQYEQANEVLRTYVMNMPRDPLGHDSLGVSYSQLDNPLQAVASFVNAINLSPDYYMPYYNLGVVLTKLGLYEYALNVYRQCLRLNPSYINAMNNIADLFKKLGQVNDAIDIFKEILELDPNYTLALKNLANCYLNIKDYYSALLTHLKALQAEPQHQGLLFNISLCLDRFGLYENAAQSVIKSYHAERFKSKSIQNRAKPFIAAGLFHKHLLKLNCLLRLYKRLRKKTYPQLYQRIHLTFKYVLQCFEKSAQLFPGSPEIKENIKLVKLNMVRFLVKNGELSQLISFLKRQKLENSQQFLSLKKKQIISIRQIWKWRKFTKRIIKIPKRTKNQAQIDFQRQRKLVEQKFRYNRQLRVARDMFGWKMSSYISRSQHHNLNRLIIKRVHFIKRYNKLNEEIQQLFKFKPLLTTLTESNEQQRAESALQSSPKFNRLNSDYVD